jgi:hypothetical protein
MSEIEARKGETLMERHTAADGLVTLTFKHVSGSTRRVEIFPHIEMTTTDGEPVFLEAVKVTDTPAKPKTTRKKNAKSK